MKAVFLGLYFPPETFSSPHMFFDVVSWANDLNFDCHVLTPNPVRGLSSKEVKELNGSRTAHFSGYTHHTFSCLSWKESNPFFRLFRAWQFGKKAKKWIKKQPDIAFVYIPSNPPFIWNKQLKHCLKKRGIKLVFNINDIYPEVAFPRNSLMGKFLSAQSRKALFAADQIVTLSEDMKISLCEKCPARVLPIAVIPPWSYPIKTLQKSQEQKLLSSLNYSKDFFNVFYVGNFGQFQNLDLLVQSSNLLQNNPKIRFYLVGSGRRFSEISNASVGVSNLSVHPQVTPNEAAFLYSISDLNIISLNKNIIHYACPSKTPLCLESGRPTLTVVGESVYVSTLLTHGNVFTSEMDPKKIAEEIEQISQLKLVAAPPSFGTSRLAAETLWKKIMEGIRNENR
jgi:glycosyltransferase involved in cell wall biosynthesis